MFAAAGHPDAQMCVCCGTEGLCEALGAVFERSSAECVNTTQ